VNNTSITQNHISIYIMTTRGRMKPGFSSVTAETKTTLAYLQ